MIWIPKHPKHCWFPGKVLKKREDGVFEVEDEKGKIFKISEKKAIEVHSNSLSKADISH